VVYSEVEYSVVVYSVVVYSVVVYNVVSRNEILLVLEISYGYVSLFLEYDFCLLDWIRVDYISNTNK